MDPISEYPVWYFIQNSPSAKATLQGLCTDTPAIIKQLNFNFAAQFIKASYQTLRQLS